MSRVVIEEPLFVRCSDLRGADFSDAIFSAPVILDGSCLRGARFCRARLSSLCIRNCDLTDVSFRGARIGGSDWQGSSGRRVDCRDLSMWHSSLRDVCLPGSLWQGALLQGIAFSGADLRGADFSETDFQGSLSWDSTRLQGTLFPQDFSVKKSSF